MIKKFNLNEIYSTTVDGIHWEYHPNKDDILEKINEIIDAVNAIQDKSASTFSFVKHGKWINEPNCWYRCSVCGEHYPSSRGYMNYNYCPNCGANMKE